MKRTLHIKREVLGSLGDDELSGVVGGYVFTREGGGLTCGGAANCIDTHFSCGCIQVTLHRCIDLSQLACYCNSFPSC